ncbi:MAG TPA: hypothetical protein PLU71_04960 [Candidatus Dependentiae bacterium]|nr:hypothetical protein [Candidatus Dependentiae bacterium]HRQ63185.1 hypothetical protein [Candidatus Dependentiae bacterium]
MFPSSYVIAIVFRIINFIVFGVVLVYLFKKYLLDSILQMMAQKDAEKKMLHEEADALQETVKELDSMIEREARECEELKRRVIEWRKRVEQELDEQRVSRQEQAEQIRQTMATKAQHLYQQNLERAALPSALEQAREQLHEKFSEKPAGVQYIKSVVDHMKSTK